MSVHPRKHQPVKRFPVHAQLDPDLPAFGPMDWSKAELRAAAASADANGRPGWHAVWCPVCGELAAECPVLRRALAGVALPAGWSDGWAG